MAPHKCNDNCPVGARNGPKTKCVKCNAICYLQCFDFEAGGKVDSLDTVKITTNGMVFATFLSTMAFVCCADTMTAAEQRKGMKIPSARAPSKARSNDSEKVANELASIKEMLTSIKSATDANTAEIAAIKSLSTETEANVKKVTEHNASLNQLSTPAPALNYVRKFQAQTYAAAAAATPNSTKRKRLEMLARGKPQFPAAKVGLKSNVNGLTVVPKFNRDRDAKPKFSKALYVSRLNPSTSIDEISDYITANTLVIDKNKFSVHKMVKKGVDESTLKFVSFKVEMNAEELDVLDDATLWPEGVQVREFQQAPLNEFGNYFPALSANRHPATSSTVEQQQTTMTEMETQ